MRDFTCQVNTLISEIERFITNLKEIKAKKAPPNCRTHLPYSHKWEEFLWIVTVSQVKMETLAKNIELWPR